jgi:hypothetical protein
MKNKPNEPLDEWLRMLTSPEVDSPTDKVLPGYLNTQQIADLTRISLPAVQRKIKKMRELGLIEERRFRIRAGSRVYPVPHYILKSGASFRAPNEKA